MDIYFSDVFDIAEDALENYGAFNVSLINDLPLFMDPFLLFNSTKPEYQELHDQMIKYLRFLKSCSENGKIHEGLLLSWFMFSEVKQNWLGYSLVGNSGSGLGIKFARALNENLHTVFSNFGEEKVTKGSHLEKLCLIKDGVGRDNISDFTTNLIKDYLLNYTQEFAVTHLRPDQRRVIAINKVRFNYDTCNWERGRFELPWYDGDYVLLTPKDILTKDDTWINKSDIVRTFDDVADSISNLELRTQINQYFAKVLPEDAKNKDYREAVSSVFNKFPELIDFYIKYKEDTGDEAISVSESRVKQVEFLFIKKLREFVDSLNRETGFYSGHGYDTLAEARDRVLFLKDVIENKGGHRLFFVDGEPLRRESDLQILFRLTWCATPSDVSREVNDGRGPVDFKISRGRYDKSLVEFKLAKNSHLRRNLEKQVEIYKKASDAPHGLKVILYFIDQELEKVTKIFNDLGLHDHPDVILIDGRATNKPSGSKA
jgi:hypothetical protein